MIRVDIPEKNTFAEFPDGTPPDVITRAIKRDIMGIPDIVQDAQQYPLNETDKHTRMNPPAIPELLPLDPSSPAPDTLGALNPMDPFSSMPAAATTPAPAPILPAPELSAGPELTAAIPSLEDPFGGVDTPDPGQVDTLGALIEGTKQVARNYLGAGLGDELARDPVAEASRFGQPNLQSLMPMSAFNAAAAGQGQNIDPADAIAAERKQRVLQLFEQLDAEHLKPDSTLIRPDGFKGYVQDVIKMAPQIAGVLGANLVAGPPGGMAFMGQQIAGGDVRESLAKGIEPERAWKAALADATMQAPLEQLGISKALKFWQPSARSIGAIKAMVQGGGTEWLTELAQKYPELITKIWAAGKDKDPGQMLDEFTQGFWEATQGGIYEGAVAAPFGAAIAGTGAALNKPGMNEQQILDELKNIIETGNIDNIEHGQVEPELVTKPKVSDSLGEIFPPSFLGGPENIQTKVPAEASADLPDFLGGAPGGPIAIEQAPKPATPTIQKDLKPAEQPLSAPDTSTAPSSTRDQEAYKKVSNKIMTSEYGVQDIDGEWLGQEDLYVHGRSGGMELSDDGVVLVTQDMDTASSYGRGGSVHFFKAPSAQKTIDLSSDNTADMDVVVADAISDGMFSDYIQSIDEDTGREIGLEDLSNDKIEEEVEKIVREAFSPEDIVDSAGAYDNPDFYQWFYDKYGSRYDFVKTPDGGVVLNPNEVGKTSIPWDEDFLSDDGGKGYYKEYFGNKQISPPETAPQVRPRQTTGGVSLTPSTAAGVPLFKNTNEAVSFGEQATPEQIKELERLHKETQDTEARLQKAKDATTAKQDTIDIEDTLFDEPQPAVKPGRAHRRKTSKSDQEQKDLFGYNQTDMFGSRQKKQEAYEPRDVQERPTPAVPSKQTPPVIKPERRHSAIIKKMSKAFNAPVRVGKFRTMGGRRVGIYKMHGKVIRVMSANDIGTVIHESGHHIQDILGWPVKHKFPRQVRAMAYEGADNLDREGFAEFVRIYVMDPDRAQREAPAFVKEFEEHLANRPDFQNVIIEARQAIQEFKAAPSVAKVGSFMVSGDQQKRRYFPPIGQIYTAVKDSLHPIKKVVEMARKLGGNITFKDDPYIVARLLRGWARKAQQFVNHQTFQYDEQAPDGVRFTGPGLIEILSKIERSGKRKQLDTYLFAKRAVADPRILQGFNRILSVNDFKQAVKELEGEFKDVAEQLYKYNNELLTYLVKSGRTSQETADSIRAKNLFYAPLHRLIEQEASGTDHLGRAANKIFDPIKRLKGSSRDVISPTENMLRNTYAMINAAERNRLGNAVMKLANVKGMGEFIEKVPFPQRPIKIRKDDFLRLLNEFGEFEQVTQIQESEKEFTKTLQDMVKTKTPNSKMTNVVKEALTSRGWTEAEATQIMTRLQDASEDTEKQQGIVEKTIEKTTIMIVKEELGFTEMPDEVIATFRPQYKAGANEAIFYLEGKPQLFQLDPELHKALSSASSNEVDMLVKFASYPARWLRAGATTFSPEFAIRNPVRDQMTAWIQSKYGFIPGYDFLRGSFHMLRADELWQKFNTSGAAHSSIVSMDRDYLSKNLRKLIRTKKLKGLTANPLELMQKLSELTEEASRVSEFRRGLKKESGGLEGLMKAGMGAREVSLDFGRTGGETARALNMISAFWNARLEGLDKMTRTFKDHPIKSSTKAFLGITAPTLLLWWVQKDDPVYQELPTWRRTLFWNFVVHRDGKKPIVLSLPKPFEYGLIFGSLPEAALDWAYRDDPTYFKKVAKQLGKTFDLLPIPTILIPPAEWIFDESWYFNRPIVPRDRAGLDPVLQYGNYTSETIKALAEQMHKVPGLRALASPAKIENLIRGFTASAGRTALQGSDLLLGKLGVVDTPPEPPLSVHDMPGIRAVFARFPTSHSQSIERFYEKYGDLKQKHESKRERKGIRGSGLQGSGFASVFPLEEMIAQELSKSRKLARATYRMDIDPAEKDRMLTQTYIHMINTARGYFGNEPIEIGD